MRFSVRALLPVTVLYGALVGAGLLWAARQMGPVVLGWWAAGFVLWTFGYYCVHRWVLHRTQVPGWVRRIEDHHHHHRYPEDPDELEFGLVGTLPIFALILGLAFVALRALPAWCSLGSGFLVGYLAYEWLHSMVHSRDLGQRGWVQRLGRHHLRHHNRANRNYGTLVSWWDRLFGTYTGG